ncbi:MAG: 16S rRNA (adenine(1518)-N(6)/adenine(1519)-N(6))-dimethyltransferase RsmA [Bacillota bacterium]
MTGLSCPLTSPKEVIKILEKFNLKIKKRFGQNFLVDANIVRKIVDAADLGPDELVIEIGPGIGTLTQALAQRAGRVLAVELDRDLIPVLKYTLAEYPNVKVIQGDALKLDWDALAVEAGDDRQSNAGRGYRIVANLPYYITSPILIRLLEANWGWQKAVFMVQKEVAQRIMASPGSKEYGSLTLLIKYYSDPSWVTKVPHTVFMPRPKVDSAVLKLEGRAEPPINVLDKETFFRVVRASFGQRRKTILNSLGNAPLGLEKKELERVLEAACIRPELRGETLSIEQFGCLSNGIAQAVARLSRD